eukprot:819652-Prorocentrum_minimum.AAC.1
MARAPRPRAPAARGCARRRQTPRRTPGLSCRPPSLSSSQTRSRGAAHARPPPAGRRHRRSGLGGRVKVGFTLGLGRFRLGLGGLSLGLGGLRLGLRW